MNDLSIRSMPLYTHLTRIQKGLAAQGISPEDPIRPEQLFTSDQWHYNGTDAVQAAAMHLGLGPASRVLDIGSGIGGPARYLAYTTGCHVTALELQPELNALAIDLTARCGLGDRVTHLCGDALSYPLPDASFDAVVSWLAIVHIPERPRLLSRLAGTLRPGGGCYIEDLFMRSAFKAQDLDLIQKIVFGNSLTGIADYRRDLQAVGFVDVVATDLTDDWESYAATRLVNWRAGHAAYARIHGEGAYAAQALFYAVIDHLYKSGSLGGIRLTARAATTAAGTVS